MTISEYLQPRKNTKELDIEFQSKMTLMSAKSYRVNGAVVFHVLVPSSKNEKIFYDVVIEASLQTIHEGDISIEKIPIQYFSNCPSFVFKQLNSYTTRKDICRWLLPKYDKLPDNEDIKSESSDNIEKSLYLAIKYLSYNGLTQIASFMTQSLKISSRSRVISSVKSFQEVMALIHSTSAPKKDKKPLTSSPVTTTKSKQQASSKRTPETKTVKNMKSVATNKKIKNGVSTKSVKKI